MRFFLFLYLSALLLIPELYAQEFETALPTNVMLYRLKTDEKSAGRPSSLSLPFFEDFTNTGPFPSHERWMDSLVFVNNTMPSGLISRGCATFDGLDQFGVPYDTMYGYTQTYADSLTSRPIDLSGLLPSDSLYLSFTYQAKGWGFAPKPEDSLLLFMLRGSGTWERVWYANEDDYSDFKTVLVPIRDTTFFKSNFQFRFVNKATVGISNSNWHIDYLLLDKNRSYQDVLVEDVAFTKEPQNLLNDYSAMPFRHFKANPPAFLRSSVEAYLRNNGPSGETLNYGLTTKETSTSTMIGNATGSSFFASNEENNITFPTPDMASFRVGDPNGTVVFENKYHVGSIYPQEPKDNDTIIQYQIFDNYFAYDDGSAEQVYFLNLFPNAPGKTAVEFSLYMPDTVRGVAIQLPRQVPLARHKEFSLAVYKNIAINGQADELVYEETYLYPQYQDSINQFSVYAFTEPVPLSEGVFYIVLMQYAGGGSDSLYIGLDKNRLGGNHRYYNVEGRWENSLIDGALLLRPIVGSALPPAKIEGREPPFTWTVFPNPAGDKILIQLPEGKSDFEYQIMDMHARSVLKGRIKENEAIDIRSLISGIYYLRISDRSGLSYSKKLLKL